MATPSVVDCDVHHTPVADQLRRYLPQRWSRYYERYGVPYFNSSAYFQPRPRRMGMRADAWPPNGGVPGSDVNFMRAQLLDRCNVDVAILNCIDVAYVGMESADYSAALMSALNDWTADLWLAADRRFVASICVPPEHPSRGVSEIERWANDGRFVQVLMSLAARDPLGSQKYWPLYEAAEAHRLPIGIHVGGVATNPVTGAGSPNFYYELHSSYSAAAQSQLASLVLEGVFTRFPSIRFVFQESGFAWLPALKWRLDAAWRLFREDVPQLIEAPSAQIHRGVWFTTQPIEGPGEEAAMIALLTQADLADRLMFASDYPHWDFDSPDLALPPGLALAQKHAILAGNAREMYGESVDKATPAETLELGR